MNETKSRRTDAEYELINVLLDLIISTANLAKRISFAMQNRQIKEERN